MYRVWFVPEHQSNLDEFTERDAHGFELNYEGG